MSITDQPFFIPWKPEFFNGTLIVAESCPKGEETKGVTGWLDHPDTEWPHNFICRHVQVKRKQDDATFRALRQSFLYNGQVLDTVDFWDRHAFSNLIPRLLIGKERPTAEDWRNAVKEFQLIVDFIHPHRILIASAAAVEALKGLSDGSNYVKIGEDERWEMNFNRIPAIGIYHPSSWNRQGYNLELARNATARLRAFSE